MLRPLISACALCVAASPALAQTFTLDVPLADGMDKLGMATLSDATVGAPVLISSFSVCATEGGLFAIGLTRVEATDDPFGLIEVTRRADGHVDIAIPDPADPYADLEFYGEDLEGSELFFDDPNLPSERDLTLLFLLQPAPCSDWGDVASDPATLFPVATIDGVTSMSDLLDAAIEPEAE